MYPTPTSILYPFTFYLFGLIAIASALGFVTRKSPVSAALWLVNTMFCLAVLYVMLDAPFIGVIQVLVYAGAIMVVFVFVVMLLNLGKESVGGDVRGLAGRLGGGAIGLALVAFLWAAHKGTPLASVAIAPDSLAIAQHAEGAVAPIAQPLFTDYLLAFEVTSVLLLVAIIGAVVVGRRGAARAGATRAA
jgi:NADH-quinone oxidoreductase subunit J